MRPIVTDRVAWSVGLSVCLSVCHSSEPCKTAESMEMPFGFWARMHRGNHVLDGGPEVVIDVATATNFVTQLFAITGLVGYNFGCTIPSGTLSSGTSFDSRGGFSGSSYRKKT